MTGWKAISFGPFEAAMAHGDGFTPSSAVHYRHQLHKIARSWGHVGFSTTEGLRWHRAGRFPPRRRCGGGRADVTWRRLDPVAPATAFRRLRRRSPAFPKEQHYEKNVKANEEQRTCLHHGAFHGRASRHRQRSGMTQSSLFCQIQRIQTI